MEALFLGSILMKTRKMKSNKSNNWLSLIKFIYLDNIENIIIVALL